MTTIDDIKQELKRRQDDPWTNEAQLQVDRALLTAIEGLEKVRGKCRDEAGGSYAYRTLQTIREQWEEKE